MNFRNELKAAHLALTAWARVATGATQEQAARIEFDRVERVWPKVPPEYQEALFAFYRHPGTASDKARTSGMTLGTWRALVTHGRRQVSHLLRGNF